MAKVFGPLLSIDAKKSVGRALTFQKRPRGRAVMQPPIPSRRSLDEPTAAQVIQRASVKALVEAWQGFSADKKAAWDFMVKRAGLPIAGYHYYLKRKGIVDPGYAWYSPDWSYRVKITILSAKVPANMPDGGESGFPIDFIIDPPNDINDPTDDMATTLFDNIQSNGEDILITASDGITKLAHVIKDLVTADGSEYLTLAFLAPSILASQDTSFYIYYGNATCGDQQQTVYLTADKWISYYSLSESVAGAGNVGVYKDIAEIANHATDNVLSMGKPKKVGLAQQFEKNGTTDNILIPTHANLHSATPYFSFWLRARDVGQDYYPKPLYRPGEWEFRFKGWGKEPELLISAAEGLMRTGSWSISTEVWYKFDCFYDGLYLDVYQNGIRRKHAGPYDGWTINDTNNNVSIVYDGMVAVDMDEVAFSSVPRSANWIKAIYNCQSDNNAFWTVAAEESL